MNKDVVIYRNRIEVKILTVVFFVLFVPLVALLLVETVKRGIEELLPYIIMTFSIFLFLGFWIFIIARYKVIFDFINKTVSYTPYFKKTKKYKFKEIVIKFVSDKTTFETNDIYFYVNNKKIFKINEMDFEFQTKCNISCLIKSFKEEEKIISDIEKYLLEDSAHIKIYNYSFHEHIGVIYLTNKHISFGYDNKAQSFIIKVYEEFINEQFISESKILFESNEKMNYEDLLFYLTHIFRQYSDAYLLKAVATKLIDNSSYPEIIECEIVDAKGTKHIFHEKWPVVSTEDYDDVYPKICDIACIIEECNEDTVIINTNIPWGCVSVDGEYRFEVFKKDLIEYKR